MAYGNERAQDTWQRRLHVIGKLRVFLLRPPPERALEAAKALVCGKGKLAPTGSPAPQLIERELQQGQRRRIAARRLTDHLFEADTSLGVDFESQTRFARRLADHLADLGLVGRDQEIASFALG